MDRIIQSISFTFLVFLMRSSLIVEHNSKTLNRDAKLELPKQNVLRNAFYKFKCKFLSCR